ncbi:acetyl/propionyl/methylcrotonyl-CoA carboxylase subunit alpha [Miltoncostaea marina]|uniref:acetyl/propionyl/methylcrotonyl-CoA carboxylase subunit alpha n=1 Tax=Miltoncostaea marina TaxID=2843215 RepID=UPI001C3DC535|nr:acetyl-CoA carboxylase biotin carboxylase subunit [Miltoncostaea marina]
MFTKVMVANRGEIAIRVFRTLREMGIRSVAVYSDTDRDALFVAHADEAYSLGPGLAAETYLDVGKLIAIAREAGVEAVHPGYGFLAENAGFARALAEAGIVWIGPPPDAIDAMGSKVRSRALMDAAGVPIVPGVTEPVADVDAAREVAERIGYPVAVKASSGGGGKGFRVALTPEALPDAFEGAIREGERFFADGTVYLERYLPEPRHVEIQIVADDHGACVWLGERDCSVQRRHQKLVEETPSPVVSDDLRRRMGEASVRAATAVGYRSAGTIEYLVSGEEFFFLEMNTRIQVEHTVTEMVTGLDLVREQIRIAAGEPLSVAQDEVRPRGHAFECRINAEDAEQRFLPSPALITAYREPAGPGVRVDSGVRAGSQIPEIYDPMVAKLVVWDVDRESARRRMLRALDEYVIEGPATLIPFHRWLLRQEEFIAGGALHAELNRMADAPTPLPPADGAAPAQAAPGDEAPEPAPQAERHFTAEVNGRRFAVALRYDPPAGGGGAGAPVPAPKKRAKRSAGGAAGAGGATNEVVTPMQGTVLRTLVEVGQQVEAGAVICIVEAMKMENEVAAHQGGTVKELRVADGQGVAVGEVLAIVE